LSSEPSFLSPCYKFEICHFIYNVEYSFGCLGGSHNIQNAFVKKKAVWAMETSEVSGCHAMKLGKGGTSELCRYHANCKSVLSNLITRN
jgi:hypothetical protein